MTRNGFRTSVLGGVAALGLAWSLTSSALTISGTVLPGANLWSDNDAEVLIDRFNSAGAPCPGPGCTVGGFPTVDPGDILISALGFNQYNAFNGASVSNEATGLFILQVLTATPSPASNCGGATSCNSYTFGAPTAGFNTEWTAFAASIGLPPVPFTDANGNPLAPGTAGIIFFDNSRDFFLGAYPDFAPNIPTTYAGATNGTVVGTVGITSFTGSAPHDLVQLTAADPSIMPGQGAGGFAFVVPLLSQNFPGFVITSPISGTSNISEPNRGPFVDHGIRTDTTVAFNARGVPEPATITLLGLGLLALGFGRRKRG